MKSKIRYSIRNTLARKDNGRSVFRVGVCFGYWPCLKAPFIQISVGKKTIDVWLGLPSYRDT
jgi:hypothetical protein